VKNISITKAFIILLILASCVSSKKNVYILPKNYQGVVIIFHEIENGKKIHEKKNAFVHYLNENGVLLIKNSFCESCSDIEYYYEFQSSRNKINYCWGCNLNDKYPMVYNGSTGVYTSGNEIFYCTIFIVGTKSNEDSLTKIRDNLDIKAIYNRYKNW
jgi:hypothetical protein